MDQVMLEDLMAHYGQDVWNYAYFLTKNRMHADDIAQDAFIQAYRHVRSFRGESSVKTWLLRITRNISFNYMKSAFFRKVFLMGLAGPKETSRSAEEAYFEKEAANEVWRRVFTLPAKLRETLVLHAKYQLSIQEIANILQIPEGTVKSRLFTARQRLSKTLGGADESGTEETRLV
jgi:RNA polymerase sigma-70 factor (ECF subfamily)